MKTLICGEKSLTKVLVDYLSEKGYFLITLSFGEESYDVKAEENILLWKTEEISEEVSRNLIENASFLILIYPYKCEKYIEKLLSSPYLNGKYVILVDSYHVYGKPKILPVTEEEKLNPQGERGWKELLIEDKLKFFSYKFNYSYLILRTGEVYGPGVEGWISDSIKNALKDEEIILWDEGELLLDLIYVQDFLEAVLKSIKNIKKLKGETINLASGRGSSLKMISKKILSIVKKKENLIKFSSSPSPFPQVVLSPSKEKILLSWVPRYDIDRGLEITIRDIRREL